MAPQTIRILLVEDNAADARLVREALAEGGNVRFEVDWADRLATGLARLTAKPPDVLLLDLSVPDSHGLETLSRARSAAGNLPIVVLTGHEDEGVALQAVRSGAQDYLVKGRIAPAALVRAIRYALERSQASTSDPRITPDLLASVQRHLERLESEREALMKLLGRGAPARDREPPRFEPDAVVAGRYRIDCPLGQGASGRVFLARDETLGRRVALKALNARREPSEETLRRFLDEARAAAGLEHPNVVRVYDFGYAGPTPYLVLEYVEGGSLAAALHRVGRLEPAAGALVLGDVLSGLAYVHERGLLHRDLKPGNILLGSDGGRSPAASGAPFGAVAKIADFGLAVSRDPDEESRATETQDRLESPGPRGTPAYMSPEAVLGLPLSPASDVYSAGAILYQVLTGETYLDFASLSAFEIRRAVLEDPPRLPVDTVPRPLQEVWLRALAKDPRGRYATASGMREALFAAIAESRLALPKHKE